MQFHRETSWQSAPWGSMRHPIVIRISTQKKLQCIPAIMNPAATRAQITTIGSVGFGYTVLYHT